MWLQAPVAVAVAIAVTVDASLIWLRLGGDSPLTNWLIADR